MRGDLRQFGQFVLRLGSRGVPVIHSEVHRETARTLFLVMAPEAPVGHFPTSSRGPGRLRSSLNMSVGEPIFLPGSAFGQTPGIPEAQSGLAGHGFGDSIFMTYGAKEEGREDSYAWIIERGIQTDTRGRRTGSEQRPEGWVLDTLNKLDSLAPAIYRRALTNIRKNFR